MKREKVVIDNDSITKTVAFCVKWFLGYFLGVLGQNGFKMDFQVKKHEPCLTKQHNWGENRNLNLQGQAQARMAFYFYF
jgi:hypothetical protein